MEENKIDMRERINRIQALVLMLYAGLEIKMFDEEQCEAITKTFETIEGYESIFLGLVSHSRKSKRS